MEGQRVVYVLTHKRRRKGVKLHLFAEGPDVMGAGRAKRRKFAAVQGLDDIMPIEEVRVGVIDF